MIRTFAIRSDELLDEEARKAWDKRLSDFEALCRRVKCSLVGCIASAADGVRVVQYHVKKDGTGVIGHSQLGPIQGTTPGSDELTEEEFDRLVAVPEGRGVRVLH
jgi:hypothetical protein